MTETLGEEVVNSNSNGNGHPQISEICLNHILCINQLSQEQLQRLMELGEHDQYRFCSGCTRDWGNQYYPDYNPYILIEGIHS